MMWDNPLQNRGTSFYEELQKVCEHLSENSYDLVIVTNFEAGFDLDKEQWSLNMFNPQVEDYMYSWEKEEVEQWPGYKEGIDYCQGGTHSEVVLTPEWLRNLNGVIHLCGAFDGECIEDMEYALEGAGKKYKRIEHLIT